MRTKGLFLSCLHVGLFAVLFPTVFAVLTVPAVFAFTEPTENPPGGNAPAPVNVGATSQTRQGPLIINGTLNVNSPVTVTELCLPGPDCRSVWPAMEAVAQPWTVVDTNTIYYSGNRVGIGTNIPAAPLHILSQNDNLLQLNRNGAIYKTTLRIGTDNALVIESGGLDTLTLRAGTVTAAKNLYAQQAAGVGAGIVGLGELKQMTLDWPTRPVYGFGWFAETGQIGALIPENQIFGIYGASANLPQAPGPAYLFVYGEILSRNPGWTTPMRTSDSGPGTISGNAISFGWTGSELKTAIDTSERYIHTCTSVGSGCDDYEVPADITGGAFDIRCPGTDVMRGVKWDGASVLSVICAR